MPHILIVCTANICRSPLAEAVLRQRLQQRGLTDWVVSSAGTWAIGGLPAAENSRIVAAAQGLDLNDHRSRPVTEEVIRQSDLILCLASGHAEALRTEFPDDAHRIYLLTQMAGENYSVADPYGRPLPEYERMAAEVTGLIDKGLEQIMVLAELAQVNEEKRLEIGDQRLN